MAAWLENLSIRTRLVLLMVGVLLPVAALLAWVLVTDVRQARAAADEKVRILATGTAADLQRFLDLVEPVLERMSARPLVGALDPGRCDPQLPEFMLLGPAVVGFTVHDARGKVVCQYALNSNPPSIAADASWLQAALAAGKFTASDMFVDERTGGKVAALAYPIRGDGTAQTGLLVATLDLLRLNEQLIVGIPKNAVVTVLDRSRTVLLRSANPGVLIGSRPLDDDADPAMGAREGYFAVKGRDGVPRLVAFLTLPDIDWRVAASFPQADVLARYNASVRRTIVVGLVLCFLALALAWWMSADIANPIAHLRETADGIAAGNAAIRAQVAGPPEIRSVARQLNRMLDAQALSEARLRGIFDSAVDAILTINEQQAIVQANPAAAEMLRCAPDALIGTPLSRFIPSWFWEHHAQMSARPMGLRRDVTALRTDGESFPVEASISHTAVAGRPLYTVILRDETERKLAEEVVRTSASTLQAALSSMTDAVAICDSEGRFIEINDAFASFHRFAGKAACERKLAEYPKVLDVSTPCGEPVPLGQWAVSKALRGETATNVEYRMRRKDTDEKWVGSFSYAPIRSTESVIVGAVVTARDVTGLREVQADLKSSHVALQQLIASRDQVQEEERGRIARELHDDLQQTLAAIRMDLRAISERFGPDAPKLLPLVAGVDGLAEQAVVSTRRIVNDLRPAMLEDLGLLPSLEALVGQFSQQNGMACEIDASEELSDELMETPAVALCLYRIAQEALNNVAKHSAASEVRIALGLAPDGAISLRISDNGRGMIAAEPRKAESFGILGIQERLRAYGGTLRIRSAPGSGTEVDVLVPRVVADGGPVQAGDGQEQGPKYTGLDDTLALPRLLSRATHKTLQDVIDALAGNVAIVDRHGVIRFVNRAWTEFAERNGNPGAETIGPGVNYLEVCRRSASADGTALRVFHGLDGVMKGHRPVFSCEYPCHSPSELRWFQMHATPMATGDVMVAHFVVSRESQVHVVFDDGGQS
ncbi:PAS domain-containing protein [Variovorax sp. GT1P44]|uniref:PAS domain-containing protein n=1 Tax=Variovorax sp. GT1P44 TaxID=3443742 RepID=UPI003F45E8FF